MSDEKKDTEEVKLTDDQLEFKRLLTIINVTSPKVIDYHLKNDANVKDLLKEDIDLILNTF